MHTEGDLDLADAIDFNAALAADAHQQLLAGSTESLDVRRSIAAGNLARNQATLDLADTSEPTAAPTRRKREVVLHVHLEHAAVQGIGGAPAGCARASTRPRTRSPPSRSAPGAANPDTQITVQPVLDLAEHIHVGSYQASARLKLQTQLRDHTCAFAFCFRPAENCDCEHRVPHDRPTTADRPAPATRRRAVGDITAPRPPAAGPM